MKDMILDDFQNCVDDSLIRHRSILDVITKYAESASKVDRSIAKAVTNCGCIQINATKQNLYNENYSKENLNENLDPHISGKLCEHCREVIENEIGNNIFYLTALCNHLDINLYDILIKEYNKTKTLGKYNLR